MKTDEMKQAFLEAMAEAIMIPDDTIPAFLREGKHRELVLRDGKYVEVSVTPASTVLAKLAKHRLQTFDHDAEKERRITEYALQAAQGLPIQFQEPIPGRPKLKRELHLR